MGIRTTPQDVAVYTDPPSLSATIAVLSGGRVQTFDTEDNEYEPDRGLVPLVLMPQVSICYPGEATAQDARLDSVEWFEGAPQAGGANKLTGGEDGYEFCDGSEEGCPAMALKVTRNVPPEKPLEIFARFYFTNRDTGASMSQTAAISLHSNIFKGHNYHLELTDQPAILNLNPLTEAAAEDGAWLHTATMQLYDGTEAVADANAAYWWEVLDNGAWRAVTDDDIDLFLDCKDSAGNFKKSLTLDVRMVDDAYFRCKAAHYEGERPTAPADATLLAQFSVHVAVSRTLDVRQWQFKGIKNSLALDKPVGFRCALYDNQGDIAEEDYEFFDIGWKAKSVSAGSREISLGTGREVTFVPVQAGLESGMNFSVWVVVGVYSQHAAITDGDSYVTDAAGNLLIDKVFV